MQRVFYALFTVLLAVVIACWWSFQSSSNTISAQLQDATKQTVQQSAHALSLWMERYDQLMERTTRELVEDQTSGSLSLKENGINEYLKSIKDANPAISQIFEFPADLRTFDPEDFNFHSDSIAADRHNSKFTVNENVQGVWLNAMTAANGRSLWFPPVMNGFSQLASNNSKQIIFGRTFSNGERMLIMEVNVNVLLEQFPDLKIGKNGHFAVIDSKNTVVISDVAQWIGVSYPTPLGNTLLNGYGDAVNPDQTNVRLMVSQIEDHDWFMVGSLPEVELSEATKQPLFTMLVSAVLLLAGLLLTFVLFRRQQSMYIELSKLHETLKLQSEELIVKNGQLEQLNKMKDQILANTSHELRTPLNGIIGIAESLLDGAAGLVTKEVSSNLQLIVSSGRRLSNLVNDILDFSKMQNKTISLRNKPVLVHGIAQMVWNLSKPVVGSKPIEFKNEIPMYDCYVWGDEDRILQIFHNLIGNAIKFTERGEICVRAKMGQHNMVELTVHDTGMGIPKDQYERIFHSFEQGDGSTERAFGGTGLGLSVTKQLVELHGGSIRVESEIGKYSDLIFTMPFARAGDVVNVDLSALPVESEQTFKNEQQAIEFQGVSFAGEMNILIVDDEPINLQVLVNHLKPLGYGLTTATNGLEALGLIKQRGDFDLVLCDVMMPKLSGYDVSRKIRETHHAMELPIILLTAKNQPDDLARGFEAGASDYVTKPFSKSELVSRMQTHLKLARSTRQVKAMKNRLEQVLKDKKIELPQEETTS